MTIGTMNDVISTIPDPYKLEEHLKEYKVLNKSRGIFLSLVLDFYEMLADPNIGISADFSEGLLSVFREAALAMLDETKNRELVKYYHCHPNSTSLVRKEVKMLIENCDIYAI